MKQTQMTPKYKHILELYTREWFDKVNGNTYFSACIVWDDKEVARLPFQYGYGDSSLDAACECLYNMGLINTPKNANGIRPALWRVCEEQGIKLIEHKKSDLKRYVKAFGESPSGKVGK